MAFDYFLKIDGIKGETTDAKRPGEIDVESFSWGVTQSGTAAAGPGGGAGRANFQDFSFVTRAGSAGPPLFLACASGQHLKQAILTGRRAGREQMEFLKITLSDVVVSGFSEAAVDPTTGPQEQLTLNFSKIEIDYGQQRADGSLGGSVSAGWDLKANKKV